MQALITQTLLPVVLFVIMLGLGLGLRVEDFSGFRRQPRLLMLALLGQLLLLPLLALLLVLASGLSGELAAGLLIVSLAPGGATSNLISFLCRADTALSVTLTAVTSLITPFTLPLLAALVVNTLTTETGVVALSVIDTLMPLLVITLLPILLGMLVRQRYAAVAQRMQASVRAVALLFMVFTVSGLALSHWAKIALDIATVLPIVLALVALAMAGGALLGRVGGGTTRQALTVAIEVGIQNAGTALLITATLLNNSAMTVAVLIYGIFMQLPALGLVLYRNRSLLQRRHRAPC